MPSVTVDMREAIKIPAKRVTLEYDRETADVPPGEVVSVAFAINAHETNNLIGRLLTLVDATYTDPQQRKAQKDLVRREVRQWMKGIEVDCGYDDGIGP